MKRIALLGTFVVALGFSACTETDWAGTRNDSTITSDVKKELSEERLAGINVTTRDGVVTLSGTVPNAQAKERAQDVADEVAGVDQVINNLRTTMAGDAPSAPEGADPRMNPPAERGDFPREDQPGGM